MTMVVQTADLCRANSGSPNHVIAFMSQVKIYSTLKVITGHYIITLHSVFGHTIEVRYPLYLTL